MHVYPKSYDTEGQVSFREGSAFAHCKCRHALGEHCEVVHQVSEQESEVSSEVPVQEKEPRLATSVSGVVGRKSVG